MPFVGFPDVREKSRRYPLRFVESTDVTHNESASNSIPWTWFVGPFRVTVRTSFHSPNETDCGIASTTKMLERPRTERHKTHVPQIHVMRIEQEISDRIRGRLQQPTDPEALRYWSRAGVDECRSLSFACYVSVPN